MVDDKQSRCYHCENLEVWGNMLGGCRYVCFKRYPTPRQFCTYGRDTTKGVPMIKMCSEYEEGRHYSRRYCK